MTDRVLAAVAALVFAFALVVVPLPFAGTPPPAFAAHEEFCYLVSDSANSLTFYDRVNMTETIIGPLGVSVVEAMALDPTTGILYGADANDLGTINTSTGLYTSLGAFGSGDGPLGTIDFTDVDGLAFDAAGNLYGSQFLGGNNTIILIDPADGSIIPGAFGGDDYLAVTGASHLDDIAIDPTTGVFYGSDSPGGGDTLVTIDLGTGLATAVGPMGTSDMEGLSVDPSGNLIGTTGSPPALYTINKATGAATLETTLGPGSFSDYEAAACYTTFFEVADLELTKTVSNASPLSGETITYTISVTNVGEHDTTGVEVTDVLPAGLTYVADDSGGAYSPGTGVWDVGTVAVNATATLNIDAIASGSGTIDNLAEVTASDVRDPDSTPDNGVPSEDDQDNASITILTPSLNVTKTSDVVGLADPGDFVTYTIVVENDGDVTLDNVTVTDPLPGDVAWVSTTVEVPAGAAIQVFDDFDTDTYSAGANWIGSWDEVGANDGGQDPDGGDVQIVDDDAGPVGACPGAGCSLRLQDDQNEIERDFDLTGATGATLTFLYRRVSLDDDAEGAEVQINGTTLPGGQFLGASGGLTDPSYLTYTTDLSAYLGSVVTLSFETAPSSMGDNDVVFFNDVQIDITSTGTTTFPGNPPPTLVTGQSLAPGEVMTVTVVVQIDDPVTPGTTQIDNTAVATGEPPTGPDATDNDSETVGITAPSVTLDKALQSNADEDGSGDVTLNDTLTYSFVATNDGNVTLDNVVIGDPLPGLSALTCAPGAGSSLAPTESMTCTATYVVTQADVDDGQVDNTATVNADDHNGEPLSDDDTETVPVEQAPSVVVVKALQSNADEDGSGDVSLGDTLTYSFDARNDGTVTLSNVVISDPLSGLSALTCVPAAGSSLAPGATMACTATYVVTQADVDNGQIDNTATVNASDPNGNPVSDDDSETVPISQAPSIGLAKALQSNADEDGSGDVSLNDTLTYSFVATNDGDVTLDSVVISDPLPGLSALSCAPAAGASLAPTESMTCTATYVVTQADIDAGQIDNTATVNASDPDGNPVSDNDSETVSAGQTPLIDLAKALQSNADEDGSGDVTLNDTLTYSFVATNAGTVTLDNVVVSDPLPGLSALTCAPAAGSSLAPAASMTCTATYVVTQADVDNGQIDNTATVDAEDPDGNPVDDDDTETVVVEQTPSIDLAKALQSNADEDGSGTVTLNDTLTYLFVATNDGTVTLDSVTITDPLPGLSALTCAPAAGSSLAPTESMTCTATYVVTQADVDNGQVDNTATVDAADPDGNPLSVSDPETVPVAQDPSITLVKSLQSNADEDGSGDVTLNDTLTYSFVATNDGTVTLDSVVISDPLPGLSALTCAPLAGASLAPTESMTCTATYVVTQADVDNGQIDNTATVDATDPGGNPLSVSDPETVPVAQTAAINLTKSLLANADEDGSGTITLNDTLTYRFMAQNVGTVTLDNVVVSDPLPGLSVLTCIPLAGASLGPTESMTCTATYVVTQADVDSGQIDNTATVDSTDPDGNPVDDTDDNTANVAQDPSIALVKSLQSNADEDGSGDVSLNDTLTYSFVATNDGTLTLDNVTITDPLPGLSALTCVPPAGASLAPTESMTCTATYVVAQTDVDNGQIDNTATVDATDPDDNPLSVSDPETVPVAQDPSIALVKSLQSNADEDGSGTVTLNDTLTYSFVATNDGTVTLDNVSITDPLPGLSALTCAPLAGSSLAPSESMTCTATYVVTQADVDNGRVDNTATVDATDPDGNPLSVSDPETVPVAQDPSIALVKSLQSNADEDGSGDVTLNDTLTYSFVATNDGTLTLDNVTITDPLPGLSALTCAPVAGSSLAPTESMTCTATYVVTQVDVDNGQVDNTATVDADDPDGNPLSVSDPETVPAAQTPSIALVKSLQANADEDGSGDVSLNDTLTYSFVATNDGTVTLDNVVISDPLPGLSALTCAPAAGASLAPTESMTCTATYVVIQNDVDDGRIDNTATVDATDPDGDPLSVSDPETVFVGQAPSIDLVKTLGSNADEDGSGDVTLNDTLTYSFVASNTGTVTLDNVVVSDPLPGLSALTCAPAAGASLAPTESMTCTATYVVTQADVDNGQIDNTATVDATDPDGNPLSVSDPETVFVDQAASVALVKSLQSNADEDGSGDVSLNDTLTYSFVATNDGTVTLDNVVISDPLPGLSALTCAPAAGSSLTPTELMTCTATYVVTQADVDNGQIDNTATVDADDPDGNPLSVSDPETVPVAQDPSVALVKSLGSNADEDGSGTVTLNDTLTYSFVATNDGTVTLDNVVISDPLPGLSALTCAPAAGSSLAPTESMTCSATYVVTQTDVDNGQIDNTATVDAEDPDGNPLSVSDPETVPITQSPAINLTKSLLANADEDGSGSITFNDTLTYRFVAENTGDVTLDNVVISDPLPGLSVLSCIPLAGASLAPGAAMTCTATYVVTQGDVDTGLIFNTATVDATDPDGGPVDDTDDNTANVAQDPSIALVKGLDSNADEDGSGTVTLNDTLTYSFVATNDGTVTLDNVTITDPLPGLSALNCSPVTGSSLAPTETMTCTATYVVTQADVDDGQIDNTATVDADDPDGNPLSVSDPETVPVVQDPSIGLLKTLGSNADEDGSGDVSLNDTLTYSFVATNDGTVTLDNVVISDPLPGLSALTCSPVAGASLAPTESMTCTATYVVTQVDVDNGQIDNTATVDADDPDGNPLSVSDPETVIIGANPSIALAKTLGSNADEDGSGDVSLNDTLTYSFVATNDGTVTLDNVVTSDPLPGLSALSCAPVAGSSLAPAESMTCTATYVVTQADVDNGQIDNTATVDATDPDGNPLSVSDPETVPVAQTATIALTKSLFANADEDGSGTITLADTLTYQFVAQNAGSVTLGNVVVSDPLPGLSVLTCIPPAGASLAPTESMTCTATYVVTQADVDNGQIDNTATVDATDPDGDPVDDTDDNTANVSQDPSIALVKSLQSNADEDGSGDVSLNDTLTYGFVATNDGTVTLDNVTITDPLPGLSALTCAPVGGSSLAPAESMTCTATYVVTQADVDNGQIDNTATVDATDPDGNPLSVSDPETVIVGQAPSIALVKSLQSNADEDGSGDVSLNDTLTYSFVATNDGTVTLDNVTITDPLPGISALTCVPVAGSTLAPAEAMTCTATYVVAQPDVDNGQIDNTATVNATDPDGNPLSVSDPETVIVGANPSIVLVKSLGSNADEDGSGTVTLNDTLTYSFVATNDGSVTLDNVAITDPLPGLSALTCAPAAGSSLAPTDSMTCTATYVVTQADVDAGEILNTATVDATDPGGNPLSVSDPETVPVPQDPSIALVKSLQSNADEDGSGDVTLGDTLTYSFVATNDGTVTLGNVTITDPLPGISALTCAPVAGSSLAPTEAMTCTATYSVTQADADAGQIDNTATVDATDPDGNPLSVSDPESVPVGQNPVIGLAKDVSLVINNGDGTYTVTFLLTVENLGDVTLSNLVLTDDIVGQFAGLAPTAFSATDGSLAASGTWDGTAASNILAPGQSLTPSQSGDVFITFTVTPGAVTSVDNNADVTGTPPGGGSVSDTSTAGVNPDPNDDDDPGEEDPTPVSFVEAPVIGLAKQVTAGPTSNGDGSFDVTYELVVSNLGDTALNGVQITDDMSATYASADAFAVLSVSSGDLSVNFFYDGSSDINLLDGTDTLAIGASAMVQIDLTVTPGAFLGPYDNTATASGTSPGGIGVTDDSQDGVDVDPDGNGDPTDNSDPTPVTFPSEEFDLTVTKTGPGEVNDGDTATWTITVTNLGPGIAPGPIVVTDVMPAALAYVAASGTGWACGEGGNVVTCTRPADMAVGETATITLETIASGEEGDSITNVVFVESQGAVVEVIVDNNDDEATLVIGVLPATGSNLGTFAWFGLMLVFAGGLLLWAAQRRADRLWIEHGVR